ncbi:MAG: hypothetical protein ABSH41_14120 [Syntrophobacteraceae bacterium]
MGQQLKLFSNDFKVGPKLKAVLSECVKGCSLSREQIVDEMVQLAKEAGLVNGRAGCGTISLANLDAWIAPGKPNQIPLVLLPLFCFVVRDISPLCVVAAPLDVEVIGRKDAKTLAWAKMEIQARNLQKKKNRLLAEINGNETDGNR